MTSAKGYLIAMGFDRYGRDGDGDYRNGEYTRVLHTEVGDINVQIPRDRKGKFKQHTVPPYARRSSTPTLKVPMPSRPNERQTVTRGPCDVVFLHGGQAVYVCVVDGNDTDEYHTEYYLMMTYSDGFVVTVYLFSTRITSTKTPVRSMPPTPRRSASGTSTPTRMTWRAAARC